MKYIKRIIIENFQSHKYSEIDLDADLNILIGQSDKGKSAVLRALKWVLYNEPRGTDFVRHGTAECSVTVVMGDDYTVIRRRKKTKNIYIVINPDGISQEFENFGNDVPPEIIDATGIKKIKLDTDRDTKLNLNEQLDPPFLLAETGTTRAKSIGRIVNTNIIDGAERDIMKDISNNNSTIKSFERQLEEIDIELLQYKDIEIEEKNIEKIDLLLSQIDSINEQVQKLSGYKSRIYSIENQIASNKALIEKLKNIPIINDEFNQLKDKFNIFDNLNNYKLKLNSINTGMDHNSKLIINLKDIDIINFKINMTNEIFMNFKTLTSYQLKIKTLDTNINQNKKSLDSLKNIDLLQNKTSSIQSNLEVLTKLNIVNQKLSENSTSLLKGKDYYDKLVFELKAKVNQYSKSLRELGKCPTCYSIISDLTSNQIISEMEGELHGN